MAGPGDVRDVAWTKVGDPNDPKKAPYREMWSAAWLNLGCVDMCWSYSCRNSAGMASISGFGMRAYPFEPPPCRCQRAKLLGNLHVCPCWGHSTSQWRREEFPLSFETRGGTSPWDLETEHETKGCCAFRVCDGMSLTWFDGKCATYCVFHLFFERGHVFHTEPNIVIFMYIPALCRSWQFPSENTSMRRTRLSKGRFPDRPAELFCGLPLP